VKVAGGIVNQSEGLKERESEVVEIRTEELEEAMDFLRS